MQQQLSNAFCQLLADTPYRKISVDNICRRVPTSRRTFYNYFHDKAALACWTVRCELEQSLTPLLQDHTHTLLDVLCGCFSYVKRNPALYQGLLQVDEGVFLSKCLIDAYDGLIEEALSHTRPPDRQEAPHDPGVFRCFHAAGLAAVVVYWVSGGMRASERSVARDIGITLEQHLGRICDTAPQALGKPASTA